MRLSGFINTLFLLTTIVMLMVGCHSRPTAKTTTSQNPQGPVSQLISTRPENAGPLKLIVRLPADPLALVSKDRRADQLKLIQTQQAELQQKLAAISSQIQIIYTYRHVLNGFYIVVPEELASQVDPLIPQGSQVELATSFRRPAFINEGKGSIPAGDLQQHNSVKFIGADQLHGKDIKGQGIRVGVIDTGIDYTHSMLGGTGKADDYKNIDPSQKNDHFPNSKVIGGYDFVGTDYDGGSPKPLLRIPKPDSNPIDEAGHGSHVAGTIAGIGDGLKSYTGVAPAASLFALKVFGRDGSTDDAVVIAALEYAADPDGQPETDDPLDVVNLSLGSPYGTPKLLYREAIAHLNQLGTMIVASAGNLGDNGYITGAPGVTAEALSVAASIDDMEHNWHFNAVSFQGTAGDETVSEFAEATFTRPLKKLTELKAPLVYVGKAGQISETQAAQLNGKIALIDRGEVAFFDKITNVLRAGAIAAVVINDIPGSPMPMGGGKGTLDIPAVMISIEPGTKIRERVMSGEIVLANLKTDKQFAKPELIDTITGFSSRGPRSEDSLIKPEISAPGSKIISAKVGGGTEVVPMSGTSMAAPHMSGVMALLKQTHPDLNPQQLKALAMLSAKPLKTVAGKTYPIAQQGAGRVQVPQAVATQISVVPAAISLGRHEIMGSKTIVQRLQFKNLKNESVSLTLSPALHASLQLSSPTTLTLKPLEVTTVELRFKLTAPATETYAHELDGFVLLKDQGQTIYSLPVLAVALKVSDLTASPLQVHAGSALESPGSLVTLNLKNASPHSGAAYLFQLLGQDGLKATQGLKHRGLSTACDLESVGYRTVKIETAGKQHEVLQMALKLYNPVTTWNSCEFSVQIDANGDGIADQELAGLDRQNTEGLGKGMASLLLNANRARTLRKEYEAALEKAARGSRTSNASEDKPEVKLDFTSAIEETMDLIDFKQSSLLIIQTPLEKLKAIPGQNLRVKVAALSLELDAVEADDFLGQGWLEMPLNAQAQTLSDIPEKIEVTGRGEKLISLTKGEGLAPLVIYYPMNRGAMTSTKDAQSQLIELIYSND